MTDAARELADRLEAVVRGIPGVTDLYAAAPLLAQAAGELPVPVTERPSLIHVTRVDEAYEVVVNLGVDPTGRAPVTAADVAGAIRAADASVGRVTVRVSRVA